MDLSLDALSVIGPSRVHTVAYERFVADPIREVQSVLDFAGVDFRAHGALTHDVRSTSVGSGRRTLATEQIDRMSALVGPTQERRSRV